MGMNMQMITNGWLVLRLADDSPLALALVMMSFAAPMTFMSPIGGALADRIPRKRLLMLSQGGNAVLTILLATLDVTGVNARQNHEHQCDDLRLDAAQRTPFGALAEQIGTPDALGLSGLLLAALTVLFALAYPSFRRIA